MKKPLIAVSAIALLAAAGYGGLVFAEKKIAEAVVAGMNEGGTTVTVKAARYSLLNGRLELEDVVATDKVQADRKFAAALLVAEGANRDAGGLVARGLKGEAADTLPVQLVKKLDVTGVRWSDGEKSVVVERLSGANLSVVPGKLPRAASLAEAFTKPSLALTMAAFGADRLEFIKATGTFKNETVTTDTTLIETLAGGVAETLETRSNVWTGPEATGKLAKSRATGIDLAGLAADRLSAKTLSIEGGDFAGKKGEKIAFGAITLTDPKPLDFGALDTAPEAVAATWSVGNLAVKDLAVTVPEEQTDISLGLFELDKFGEGKLASAKLAGLKVDVKKTSTKIALGEVAVETLDYTALLAGNPTGLVVKKVSLDAFEVDVAEAGKLALGKAVTEYTRFEQSLPAAGYSTMTGLTISDIRDPEGREAFKKLGYEGLSFDGEMRFDWKAESGAFVLETFKLTGKDMGALNLAMTLGGLDYETAVSGDPFAFLETMRLESLDLRYDDESLFGRVLKLVAAEQGARPEDIRDMALTILDEQRRQVSKNPIAVDAIKGLKTFVEKPKNLTFSLRPNEPVGYEDLMDEEEPAAVARLLGVKVEANK
ncbi:hypothetical protein ACFSM5_15870 [Lacibacterium aquatile]|uniref:DUF945 family protein n=1 Tax=Lacibacterium aquatile TaxID=1168082 RepID=A0ABW5DTY6_9PROT